MGIFDMLKKMNPESVVYGFLMGPHGVYSNSYMEVCGDYMNLYRNMGGFDMICKSNLMRF
jgi:pyrophosphate--fructose-6-phosphate 1-phosphotransferase